ncbi:hypothetical protein BGW39_011088 [Mortierella sp. 14UC]|nr:hypothetical protein BGW39_011088 [Mortierella sp. 14UC]
MPYQSTATTTTTSHSRHYLPQIRKAWGDRTSSMSWSISTAFFTSVICTILAIAALALNWEVPSVYLKLFLIVFVVRKWAVTLLMADRALYRLPLNLTEPDPDIDEERHNGIAIYMSQLFTWHGYAMLLFGQFFVLFYASGTYLPSYPIITGVSLAFACMGLAPFFSFLSLLLVILSFLYFSYMVIYLVLWPLSYWGLVQRRAISRMNGGYQSEGTTNTTDLNQIARSIEDAESGRGGGFGGTDHLKLTPAMMAIPIVVYKKPGGRPVMTTMPLNAAALMNASGQQPQVEQPNSLPAPYRVATPTSIQPMGDQSAVLVMPQPRPRTITTSRNTQNDALNRMSSNLSALYSTTPPPSGSNSSPGNGRSRASTVSMLSANNTSFIPCVSGQEMSEVESRRRAVSAFIPLPTTHSSQPIPAGTGTGTGTVTPTAVTDAGILYPSCLAASAFPANHQRNYSSSQVSNISSHSRYSLTYQQNRLSLHESFLPSSTAAMVSQTAIASLPPPRSLGTPSSPSSFSTSSKAPSSSSLPGSPHRSGATSVAEDSDDHQHQHSHSHEHSPHLPHPPQQQHQVVEEISQGDEECAICLCDFEDGDELRHLYCNHLFHRNCVDRWLVKNAFCPKCKRGI